MNNREKRGDLPLKYRYNRAWARIIVKNFVGKYARATKILSEELGLKSNDFVDLLATGSPFWAIIRDIIKAIDRFCDKCGEASAWGQLHEYTTQMLSTMEVSEGNFVTYCDDYDLTGFRAWLRMKSQGFKGGTRGENQLKVVPRYVPKKEREEARRRP